MKKRVISILIVLAMLVGILCVPAGAATEETTPGTTETTPGTEETPSTDRIQCECGGKTPNKADHVCQDITFKPWTDPDSLPWSGNIYLETDVVLDLRTYVDANAELHIDLNGHSITRRVTGEITEESLTHVFGVCFVDPTYARLTITDSTDTPGSITHDFSELTTENFDKISNWGLIAYMENCTGDVTLYGGILDALNAKSTAVGSAIYCFTNDCTFKMYGGTIYGGTAMSTIQSHGKVELYGGEIRSGCTTNFNSGAVTIESDGSLILGGDVVVYGNTFKRVYPANIFVKPENLTIKGVFTGMVGILPYENGLVAETPTVNAVVGNLEDADITNATIRIDGHISYGVKLSDSGTQILVSGPIIAQTNADLNTFTYDTLQEAIDEYPGGDAIITMLSNWDEPTTIDKDVYLNLDGFTVADISVNAGNTLYVYDTATDDFTVEDSIGSGSIVSISGEGTVSGLPANSSLPKDQYIMVTEADGTTFHRLNLDIYSVSLRPNNDTTNEPGMYFTCNFGGDEAIKSMVQSYGVALGAGGNPDYRAKTYTSKAGTEWLVGLDANGDPNNRTNGTLLTNVMRPTNTYTINRRNSSLQIYSQGYIILNDDTKICGTVKNVSMADVVQGAKDKVSGIDSTWNTLEPEQKSGIIGMYETYSAVMGRWNIPNITAEVNGTQVPDTPYEDDGVFKVLLIGHSLGLDSGYFFPEVFKEETGKDIVVGMLYHSGCRLSQHVSYIESSAKQYAYFEYDTAQDTAWRRAKSDGTFTTPTPEAGNDSLISDGTIGVTMKYGIRRQDWDMVILQAGVFEAAGIDDASLGINIPTHITTIQNHVIANDIESRSIPKFTWNMTWAAPEDAACHGANGSSYLTKLNTHFSGSTSNMWQAIASTTQNTVAEAYNWAYILPSGTVMQNANTTLADTDLYRDMIHGNDFVRTMIAYTWLAKLAPEVGVNVDIDTCQFNPISSGLRYTAADRAAGDLVLTDIQKTTLKNSVKNAIASPYAVTSN